MLLRALDPVPDRARVAAATELALGTRPVELIEAPDAEWEAAMIALTLRETLQMPDRTAALITPDRALARRVRAHLMRYGIRAADSAGESLDTQPIGSLIRQTLRVAADPGQPAEWVALMKHGLVALGAAPGRQRPWIWRVERAWRKAIPMAPRIERLAAALEGQKAEEVPALFEAAQHALAPLLMAIGTARSVKPSAMVAPLIEALEALATTDEQAGCERLWIGEAGEAASTLLASLPAAFAHLPPMAISRLPDLFASLLALVTVRPAFGEHPRIAIWGLIEARGQQADRVILAGLTDGVWPAPPPPDPWLSMELRQRLGLPSLDQRVGQMAHDFVQACGADQVILTRSRLQDGSETVPSIWWSRFLALLPPTLLSRRLQARLTRSLAPVLVPARSDVPSEAPAPCPPAELRPRQIAVTSVRNLMVDPYAFFAKHILHLNRLKILGEDLDRLYRGTMVHRVLQQFQEQAEAAWPDAPEDLFLQAGTAVFGEAMSRPDVRGLWWPRLERLAPWFVDWARQRRTTHRLMGLEHEIATEIATDAGPFRLTARCDRLDRSTDGHGQISVLDFKSGSAPEQARMKDGQQPQLPLEALILEATEEGGVSDITILTVPGRDPPGRVITHTAKVLAEMIENARTGLVTLLAHYADPAQPYVARPSPARPGLPDALHDYAHLARVQEWQDEDADEGFDAGAGDAF